MQTQRYTTNEGFVLVAGAIMFFVGFVQHDTHEAIHSMILGLMVMAGVVHRRHQRTVSELREQIEHLKLERQSQAKPDGSSGKTDMNTEKPYQYP